MALWCESQIVSSSKLVTITCCLNASEDDTVDLSEVCLAHMVAPPCYPANVTSGDSDLDENVFLFFSESRTANTRFVSACGRVRSFFGPLTQ